MDYPGRGVRLGRKEQGCSRPVLVQQVTVEQKFLRLGVQVNLGSVRMMVTQLECLLLNAFGPLRSLLG